MKATVEGIEIEGTPAELGELLKAMRVTDHPCNDIAMLTPKQSDVYKALLKHPRGAHYIALAEEIGLDSGVVNARLNDLVKNHDGKIVKRVAAGTFVAVRL